MIKGREGRGREGRERMRGRLRKGWKEGIGGEGMIEGSKGRESGRDRVVCTVPKCLSSLVR